MTQAGNSQADIKRILLVGDSVGLPQLIEALPVQLICGVVGAEIRPHYHQSLEAIAADLGVSYLVQPRHTSPDYGRFVDRVRSLEPDLIVVNSYSMLLREELLSIPVFGAINIHTALLPRYRGSNPFQWVIINNEMETGVTMHYMTTEFDAGDIIAQRRVPVNFEDTWLDLQSKCAEATRAMLSEEVPRILGGTNVRRAQDESVASRSTRRKPEDGAIDWRHSVLSIYNLIRALVKPLPGAFYDSAKGRVTLDEYLSIPQVICLKYDPEAGGQQLELGDIRLSIIQTEPPATATTSKDQSLLSEVKRQAFRNSAAFEDFAQTNEALIFRVSYQSNGFVGYCWLNDIDYRKGTARFGIRVAADAAVDPKIIESQITKLLLSFASEELSLKEVNPA